MCGNGARCVAVFINQWKKTRGSVSIETTGGLVAAQVRGKRVRMAMPQPRDLKLGLHIKVDGRLWPLGYVDTGVPHAVAVVRRVEEVNVMQVGRRLRFHPEFHPRGTNVDFIEISHANPDRLKIRTYERGVEGETLACGTGVTAAAVIHAATSQGNGQKGSLPRLGLKASLGIPPHGTPPRGFRRITVETKSGETLTVSLRVSGHKVSDVILEGAARWICQGSFSRPTAAASPRRRARRTSATWP